MRRPVHFAVALAALLCMAQAAPRTAAPPLSPQQIYGPLFEAVQGQRIFPDGKTFVDANNGSKATTAIKQLSAQVIGAGDENIAGAGNGGGAKKSLLGNLDLKSLLAKKKDTRVKEPAQ